MNTIRLNQLTVRYGDHVALDNLSLEIPAGAFVAIVGPNGSGKSTLLKVLLGLVRPTSGQALVMEKRAGTLSPLKIGYIPQVKTLDRSFPALAQELVATGLSRFWPMGLKKRDRERALEALNRVGAEHLALRPLGRLSGGELQRIYLARSLIRKPELIMLDEPATGIDAVGEADMYRLLDDYQKESSATVLMVTHDLDAARHHSSHVLLMNREMVGFGPPEESLTDYCLRKTFGHMGHAHSMIFKGAKDD